MRCPDCDAELPEDFVFCGACGATRGAAPAAAGAAPDSPQEQQLSRRTFTALSSCRHCGGGLPWQGPLRSVRCAACLGENELSPAEVAEFLRAAAMGVSEIVGDLKLHDLAEHPCPACGAAVELRAIPVGTEGSISCARCGAAIASFPPPAWIQSELRGIVQIVGGERDPADRPAGAVGLEVAVPSVAAPVILACPNCQASIKVDGETARTCSCEFCKASVYLPDDLWRVLHPVKRAAPWSILYRGTPRSFFSRGKVESHEDDREREAARERAAARIEQVAREAEEEAARGDSRLRKTYWLVFVPILIIIALAVLWVTLR